MIQPTYIGEKEVAKLTGRKVPTLRSDRHKGQGMPYRKLNRKVLYRLDEVIDYVESHKVETSDSQ
ncbi:helix-turn-helix transcriptional regulator [Thermodesulfobacteriota bacterium]